MEAREVQDGRHVEKGEPPGRSERTSIFRAARSLVDAATRALAPGPRAAMRPREAQVEKLLLAQSLVSLAWLLISLARASQLRCTTFARDQ